MKKVDRKRREYEIRVSRTRFVRRLRRRELAERRERKKRKAAKRRVVRDRPSIAPSSLWTGTHQQVFAPSHFRVDKGEERNEMCRFFTEIREHLGQGRKVKIDFAHTRRMFADGTILFRAELERLSNAYGAGYISAVGHATNRIVGQVLQQVGLASILGLSKRYSEDELAENVRHWCQANGSLSEGERFSPFISRYEGRMPESLKRSLFKGLVEAMCNTVDHAYAGDRGDGITSQDSGYPWWMLSEERAGRLHVTFCDLGIGIPRSLKASTKWPRALLDRLLSFADFTQPAASHIKASTRIGRSSTLEEHRGKGLPEVLDVVRGARAGILLIQSDRGMYSFDGSSRKERLLDFGTNIMATIVQWTLPLRAAS